MAGSTPNLLLDPIERALEDIAAGRPCAPLSGPDLDRLRIPPMAQRKEDPERTAFGVFAHLHNLSLISIEDLIACRRHTELPVQHVARTRMPTSLTDDPAEPIDHRPQLAISTSIILGEN